MAAQPVRPELVRYLHDCFVADHRTGGVTDLFARRIEHRHFFTGDDELIGAAVQPIGVPREPLDAIARAAAVYVRERALFYCAFPLAGSGAPSAEDGGRPRVCAPLVLFPARLGSIEGFPEELLGLSIDRGDGRINHAALEAVLGDAGAAAEAADLIARELGFATGEPPRRHEAYRRLPGLLREAGVPVCGDDLDGFPRLIGCDEVETALRSARRGHRIRCLSACALALAPRSFEVRGILHGLAELAAAPRWPAPLGRLLDTDPRPPATLEDGGFGDSARTSELTVVVGPPGTGKSFTLAAVALDEHFRSTPAIIRFSNRTFYRGALRVMTRRPETERGWSLRLHRVEGRREPEGHNPAEAKALVDVLWTLHESEKMLHRDLCRTVGVLSPFRRQVEHLAERIAALPGAVAERHRLLLGTPYAFQGQERDVMLISWVLDPEATSGAFRYLDRSDVFNVAITRARSLQHVFCSLDPGHAPAGHLPRRYLEDLLAGAVPEPPAPAADAFLREVRDALAARGLGCWSSYTVAGFTVDLVVSDGSASLGIDLVGHPGAFADALDLERCRMLLRAGLPVFPLPLSAWRRDRQGAVAAVTDRLTQVGRGDPGC